MNYKENKEILRRKKRKWALKEDWKKLKERGKKWNHVEIGRVG